MSDDTHTADQRHAGDDPQVARGGGTTPPAGESASTGGVGGPDTANASEESRRGQPGPGGGAAYDLKTGNLPEPKSESGI